MSNALFKKLSAVAVVAVLGAAGSAKAAATISYSTGFESSEGFTGGGASLISGNQPSTAGAAKYQAFAGELTGDSPATVQTSVTGTTGQAVRIQTTYDTAFDTGPSRGTNGVDYFTTDSGIATPATNAIGINFSMMRAIPNSAVTGRASGETTAQPFQGQNAGSFEASFGIDVFSGSVANPTLVAGLFVRNTETTAGGQTSVPDMFVTSTAANDPNGNAGNPSTLIPETTGGQAAADGTWGNYHLVMDFTNQRFYVTGPNGSTTGPYPFVNAATSIAGVSFATYDEGSNTAFFDNFSVVPEPASIGLIGLGGMTILARRRRVQTA